MESNQKTWRVVFHYYRAYKCMTVRFRGTCHKVDNVECNVPVSTKWSSIQPYLVLQGFAQEVIIENGTAIIK